MERNLLSFVITLILVVAPGCTLVVSTQPFAVNEQPIANSQIAGLSAVQTASAVPSSSPGAAIDPSPSAQPPTGTATPGVSATPSPTSSTVPAPTITPSPTLVPSTPTATLLPTEPPSSPTATPSPTPPVPTLEAVSPDPTPTATAVIEAAASNGLNVYESTITINTYDYQSALVETSPDDPVYPYPRLNHDQIGAPSPQSYRAVVLENRYLELTILPDLGGRIYRWVDKASGKNLFYENPVIKPTTWGHRGWWLATGGMEWALPTDEHGLSEASPWNYSIQRYDNIASVTLVDTEEHSGLVSEIIISLDPDHSYFTLAPKVTNPTNAPIAYKFWINGMFGLGAPQVGPDIEFVLPGDQVTVHSTGDTSLPGEGQPMDWPIFAGRDFSDYGTWSKYLGVFAAPSAQAGYMGAYNHNTNLGVVRVFPNQVARGAKIFGPGDLDPTRWTTDGSSYFELWGGLAPTFGDELTLPPGQSVSWQEHWYAVGDMGGFQFGNQAAALNLGVTGDSVQVAAASTRLMSGQLVLWQDGHEVTQWPLSFSPERPFRGSFQPPDGNSGPWALSLLDETGREVAAIGQTAAGSAGTPPAATSQETTLTPDVTEVIVLDRDGQQRDWAWVEQEFGYQLQRAPYRSEDGRVFRLAKLQEAESGYVYVVEVRDEAGQGLSNTYAAHFWPDAPEDISNFPNQSWHGFNRAAYGYPDANGNWGVGFGPEGFQPPGSGECAFFILSPEVPSDVLSRVGPLVGTNYRVLRPTFQLVQETSATEGPSPTPTSTATPVVPDGETDLVWDPRLDDLGITVTQAQPEPGQALFRLVAARYWDEAEANWLHHVFVEVLDEGGRRIVGQPVIMAWGDGETVMVTEDKPPPEYAANAPMYNYLGEYRVYVDGGDSDVVNGLGLPGKHHVSYLLTFQRIE